MCDVENTIISMCIGILLPNLKVRKKGHFESISENLCSLKTPHSEKLLRWKETES